MEQPKARILLEGATESEWMARHLESFGHALARAGRVRRGVRPSASAFSEPAHQATKRPLVSLVKQARAFGVGVLVATQNPMDLDYRALSNADLWCVGRLQTDADRARVVEGLAGAGATGELRASELTGVIKRSSSSSHAGFWYATRTPRRARV